MHPDLLVAIILRSVLLFFVLAQITIILFLRKLQPLKSRGIVPFLCLLCFAFMMCAQIAVAVSGDNITVKPYCLIMTFFDVPYYATINILMALQAMRYFLIKNMNKFKAHVSERSIESKSEDRLSTKTDSNQVVTVVSFRFKLFKLMASSIFTLSAVGLFLLLYYAVMIPVSIFSPCPSVLQLTPTIIISAVLIIGCTLWEIGICLHDIIVNIKFIWKNILRPWRFFIVDDPFYFRLELHLWILYLLAAAAVNGAKVFEQDNNKNSLRQDIIDCVSQAFQMFFFSGLILTITIVQNVVHKKDKKVNSQVEELLKNPDLQKLFIEYSRKEWSLENV